MFIISIVRAPISEKVVLNSNLNSLNIPSASEDRLIINLQIGSFYKQPIGINEKKYFLVNLINENVLKEKGNPELPKITRSIMIPGTSDYSVNILSSKYKDINIPVIPSKGILSRIINPDDVPYSFSSLYAKDSFYPTDRFSFGEPYLIRDSRGVTLNIYPFAYNPVKEILRIYTSIELEVVFEGSNLKNSAQKSDFNVNKYFEPILSNHFINYQAKSNLKSTRTVEENGRMLIICHNDFIEEMQDFVNHKNNRELPTELVNMTSVGATADDIETFIQNEYDNDNSLTFVLLVGDHTQIPSLIVNDGGSDPSFSLVSGSDNYPDIIIGRFAAENESQVETMVARSILYENMTEQNWFHAGIGIASDDGSGNGDDSEYDWEHLRKIRTDLLNWHYNTISELYEGNQEGEDAPGNPSAEMVSNLVNGGISIINYTGHGSTTSWSTTGFSNTNVNSLTNDEMLPFIFSVACLNGNFTSNTCFAESWLRSSNSNTNSPTGAIGFYGSSINQAWAPPMQAQDRFNDLLLSEDNFTFGSLCYNASCSMMDEYGSGTGESGANMFLAWNIFGDPSVNVIPNVQGDCPENITITETLNGNSHEFLASNSITASNQISNEAVVHYGASGSITLLPGFSVSSACTFTADDNGCSNRFLISPKIANYNKSSEYQKSEKRIYQSPNKSLSIEDVYSNDFEIYPNPSEGLFYCKLNSSSIEKQSLVDVKVFNQVGALVLNTKASYNSVFTLDLSGFENGTYFVRAGSEVSKIILLH